MIDTWQQTHFARHANPKVLYDGADTSFLYHNVQSMQYTDYAEGSSDEITITLTDQKRDWLSSWKPEKGHELDCYFDVYNWNKFETLEFFHCGTFVLDDLSLSGPDHSITLKGVSQPAGTAFKETRISKNWKKITLKQIAQELMAKYNMTNLYFHGDETVIEEIEQDDQTDADFLSTVCEKYGYSLKIYKVGFVIYKKEIYEANEAVRTFTSEAEWENWEWNTTLTGTYTGARVTYTQPVKGDKDKDIDVLVGTEERLLTINERVDSEAEAIQVGKSRVNKENEKIITLSFTTMFDPRLIASQNIEVKIGEERIDGKYFMTKVQSKLDSNGLKMAVNAYKIVGRI